MWPFKKKEKQQELEWYKAQLNKSMQTGTDLAKVAKGFLEQRNAAIKLLKVYALWDKKLVEEINKIDPSANMKEGPATIFLKSIGEYHAKDQGGKTYGH